MPKIFLSEVPCSQEFMQTLQKALPEINNQTLYTYLVLRKVTTDLENALESYFSHYNISAGKFVLLMSLYLNSEGMKPSELAQHCGVTQATISGLLNGLEKSQLIVRETHNQDGRAYVIKLSEYGVKLINNIRPEFFSCIGKMFDSFMAEERQALCGLLERLCLKTQLLSNLKPQATTA